jgi:inosine/xanthosine triphosphate pyrophosphatase family protein
VKTENGQLIFAARCLVSRGKLSLERERVAQKKGTNGFGYDPIFFVPTLGKMMAELQPSEKAAISHRGNAIKKIEAELPNLLK